MKRNQYRKAKILDCKVCNTQFISTGLPVHIKYGHNIQLHDYVEKYGEFRKSKLNKRISKKVIRKVKCQICNASFSIVGIHVHFRDTHQITVAEYIKRYEEYRPKYLDYNERARKNKIQCRICNEYFGSERLLAFHIRIDHNTVKLEYIKKYIFNYENQYCKCGCKQEVRLKTDPPYRNDYISGHNSVGEHNPNK